MGLFSKKQKPRDEEQYFFKLEEENTSWLKSSSGLILEIVKVIVISLAIIIPVRYFLIQPFMVKGGSMEPNFFDNEYLIVDEITYRFNEPQRGDVIIFRYPRDTSTYFIKRIIGLPGEKIEIRDSNVYVFNDTNPGGVRLDESEYLPPGTRTPGSVSVLLDDNEYYVLGDNRSSSLDSRNFGPLSEVFLIGRALFRGWPFDKIDWLTEPVIYDNF